MLAELGVVQSASALVAGVILAVVSSGRGALLEVAVALWCWGLLSGLALLWSWRRGIRARAGQIQLIETARAEGLISS